ncbi:MAG: PKD domain-containing protein [Brumimicrobium sp.]
MEYVEFVVADTGVTYNCSSSTPPCIDIRGWIIDDNSGYHGTAGIASGANRFADDPLWSCVPLGTIIVVYNTGQVNPEIPSDDLSLNDGNCAIVAPITSNLFESNATTPGSVACSYPSTGWTAGGNWLNISMANGGDCMRIVDLNGCEVFSVCWGSNNQNNLIYFPGSGTDVVHYFNDGDPNLQSNWSAGCADQPNCGSQDQTPGQPNNAQNANYITQFNNNCTPIVPLQLNASEQSPSDCGCTGEAIVGVSGSIPGYTFEWFDNNFNSLNQTSNLATNLCAGTYNVVVESSIGCSDTASVTVTSNSSTGLTGIDSPNSFFIDCSINNQQPYQDLEAFLNAGGSLQGAGDAVDSLSFTLDSEVLIGSTCPEEWIRTYSVEDTCGNVFFSDQLIYVQDTIAPLGDAPADVIVDCIDNVPSSDVASVSNVSDNCSLNPTVTHVQDVSNGNTCNGEEIVRTYSIKDDCGNEALVNQLITIDAYFPNFQLSSTNPSECDINDGTILFTGLEANETYDFSFNGNSSATITTDSQGEYVMTNLSDGDYTNFEITLSSCQQCTFINDTVVTLINPGEPNIDAGDDIELCEGEEVTLNAENPDEANISWSNGVVDGVGFNPPAGSNIYTLTGELNGCTVTDDVLVQVNEIPIVEAGNDKVICYQDDVTLSASGADTYTWSDGVINNQPFNPNETNTYTVEGTKDGCSAEDEVLVTVLEEIESEFYSDVDVVCEASGVNFYVTSLYDDAIAYWDFGDGEVGYGDSINHSFNGSGCFDITLTIELSSGCSETITKENYICIEDSPVADFSFSPDHITEFSNTIDFTNLSTDANSYMWDFDQDSVFSDDENPSNTFNDLSKDVYNISLLAYNELGCVDTIVKPIKIIEDLLFYVPNSFTPDGDHINSTFKPVISSGVDLSSYKLSIYNRWGELIFVSNNLDDGWDGYYRLDGNKKAPDGTYIWKTQFDSNHSAEGHERVGHITLIR